MAKEDVQTADVEVDTEENRDVRALRRRLKTSRVHRPNSDDDELRHCDNELPPQSSSDHRDTDTVETRLDQLARSARLWSALPGKVVFEST